MTMRRLLSLALAVVLAAVLAQTSWAQEKQYYWDAIDVDITVLENSDIRVVETQTFVFTQGTFRFAYRDIPMDRLESITEVTVSEDGLDYTPGREVAQGFTTSREDGNFRITWYYAPASNERRTFILAYTVKGGLRFYEGGDQLWWKAVFPDRSFSVRSSLVTVQLPAGMGREDLKVASYGAGATSQFAGDSSVVFEARDIAPGEELEVRVQFPHGVVQGQAADWQQAEERLADYNARYRPLVNLVLGVLGLVIPLAGAVGVYLWWYTRGRDATVGAVADYLAEPPSGLSPGLVGTLVDEKAEMKDIVATIVDLARRGVIRITEEQEPGFLGIGKRRDFQFELLDHDEQLRPYEKTLLSNLFGRSRRSVHLSDLENKFYKAVPKVRSQMYRDVVGSGLFPRSPDATRQTYVIAGMVISGLAIGVAVLSMLVLLRYADTAFCPGAGVFVVGLMLLLAGQAMPKKTQKGALEAAKWRAFERYLRNIEQYTDLRRAQDIFDRYLPYAIALGVEKQWVQKFARVNTPAPTWYYPYHPVILGGGSRRRDGVEPMGSGGGSEGGGLPSLQQASDGALVSLQSMSDGLFGMEVVGVVAAVAAAEEVVAAGVARDS